ncbi:MAG: hypothetical protein ACYCSF_02795 [Acidimicrobiales bacterium]
MTSPSKTALQREVHNFYWGVWSELGVSGWARTHQHWAIDPEPLIVFSPAVLASEPRLRDEATDWCVRNWRHVSAVRLRNLLRENESGQSDTWGEFAATVNRFSGAAKWPHATTERNYTVTGRSVLRPLSERSMIYLRMRSIFGLGARTEVLRYLLFTHERSTAAMLAAQTNYAKRNVADACDSLTQAGVLSSRQVGNRLYFSLADEAALATFLGPTPRVIPDWPALLRVVNALFRWSALDHEADERVLTVETHQVFGEIHKDLETLRLQAPDHVAGAGFLAIWRDWSATLMKSLASGEYPVQGAETPLETQRSKGPTAARHRAS